MELKDPQDDSGPTSSVRKSVVGFHEKRIMKLEDAYVKISEKLLPSVARLEVKVEATNQAIVQLRNDMDGFKNELAIVREGVQDETTGNVTRDIALKAIQENEVKKLERRKKALYACGKIAITVISTLIATLILVWLNLK